MNKEKIKLYQPSNGTEGEWFMEKFCYQCKNDNIYDGGEGCELILKSMAYSKDDPEYPQEWRYNSKDEPLCTGFEAK